MADKMPLYRRMDTVESEILNIDKRLREISGDIAVSGADIDSQRLAMAQNTETLGNHRRQLLELREAIEIRDAMFDNHQNQINTAFIRLREVETITSTVDNLVSLIGFIAGMYLLFIGIRYAMQELKK